jgi:hypothetical protein
MNEIISNMFKLSCILYAIVMGIPTCIFIGLLIANIIHGFETDFGILWMIKTFLIKEKNLQFLLFIYCIGAVVTAFLFFAVTGVLILYAEVTSCAI